MMAYITLAKHLVACFTLLLLGNSLHIKALLKVHFNLVMYFTSIILHFLIFSDVY